MLKKEYFTYYADDQVNIHLRQTEDQITKETFLENAKIFLYEDKNLNKDKSKECHISIFYYPNETISEKIIMTRDEKVRYCYLENGKLYLKIVTDEVCVKVFDENGKVLPEKNSFVKHNGSKITEIYYPNGRLKYSMEKKIRSRMYKNASENTSENATVLSAFIKETSFYETGEIFWTTENDNIYYVYDKVGKLLNKLTNSKVEINYFHTNGELFFSRFITETSVVAVVFYPNGHVCHQTVKNSEMTGSSFYYENGEKFAEMTQKNSREEVFTCVHNGKFHVMKKSHTRDGTKYCYPNNKTFCSDSPFSSLYFFPCGTINTAVIDKRTVKYYENGKRFYCVLGEFIDVYDKDEEITLRIHDDV